MNCPRCQSPAPTQELEPFGGVCPKCLLDFAAEKDAPSIPNLEIVATLGEGGMGVVYKAIQSKLGRTVALKVLSPGLAADPAFVERFTREARALATLSHPNIVGIFDSGIHEGVPYLIMEYVEGTSLRKLLAAKKSTPEQALEIVPQICDALAYAHAHGVVHRDVKPENILIDHQGRVKIADFGLAKLASPELTRITRTNMAMGTPNYMAPEQIERPSAVDHRADLYSLGVVFYEMLTGELPLGRFKPPSERASTDRRLDPVVMKSLEKAPDDRYQTAGEVKEEVTHLEDRREIRFGPKPVKRTARSMWVSSAILALIALAFGLERKDRSAAIWIGCASAICGVVALSRMGRTVPGERKPDRPPTGRPPLRVVVWDPLRRAGTVLAVLVGVLVLLGMILESAGLERFAAVPYFLAGVLLVLAMGVALIALIRHALHRARGGSTGWSVALIVAGVLLLAAFLQGWWSVPPATSVSAVSSGHPPSARPTAFGLEDAWPAPEELPAGLPYTRVFEGKEALQAISETEERLRSQDPPETLHPPAVPWMNLFPDLRLVRAAPFLGGRLHLLGLEFKTEKAMKRWQREGDLAPVSFEDGSNPTGRSFFLLGSGLDQDPKVMSANAELRSLLERKMREAADRYPRKR